tara:strand:+ start:305 stop:508 length:204 start_codon:yes stop_codon:yes gene_type:complete
MKHDMQQMADKLNELEKRIIELERSHTTLSNKDKNKTDTESKAKIISEQTSVFMEFESDWARHYNNK